MAKTTVHGGASDAALDEAQSGDDVPEVGAETSADTDGDAGTEDSEKAPRRRTRGK
ncbi:hypothetical protein [Streptomyces sp. NPDC004324]